jgi:gliding motility-associated transport system ATP-binding protein
MIEVESLSKQFGITTALNGISFKVDQGEILGFLGPNGAGKTTTMRILTGFLAPTSGTARIAGFDIQKNALEARRKIGYLPESAPIYRDMYVDKYLQYVAAIKGIPRGQRSGQIKSVMDKCGLLQVKSRITGKLSKGFRQRVGLAQALLGDPEILILDEPTEGLDPRQIIEIRNLIKELGGNRTIIISTHILPEVSMICERVIIMNHGRLVVVDTPDNLNRNLQTKATVTLGVRGSEEKIVETIKSVPGVLGIQKQNSQGDTGSIFKVEADEGVDIRGKLAEKIVQNHWELFELHSETLSLEDIFIKLVTQEEEVAE